MNYICNCKKIDLSKTKVSYWENRKVTTDELDIINFLENKKKNNLKSVLHIGIGNSFFAEKFSTKFNITGITISSNELEKAKSMNLINYHVYLLDKYSIQFKKFLKKKKFDFIIDTNLKSYSCCQKSFEFMIYNIFKSIKKNGMLITSLNGMKWYKYLKPKISFSFKKLFHIKLKEIDGNENNVLSPEELKKLSRINGIKISFNDKLCYLRK
jgi:predicted TPR repeat methyltransferase